VPAQLRCLGAGGGNVIAPKWPGLGRGHAVPTHEFLAPHLRAFQPRRRTGGTENPNIGTGKKIGDTGRQRGFGAHHNQLGLVGLSEGFHRLKIERVHLGVAIGDAGVTGQHVHRGPVAGQLFGQGVLARAGTEEEKDFGISQGDENLGGR